MNLYSWLVASGVSLFYALVAVNNKKYGWFLFFIVISLFTLIRPFWSMFLWNTHTAATDAIWNLRKT